MPADPTRLLFLIREIEQTPQESLKLLDRRILLRIREMLLVHKQQVDKALARLLFIDERQLH